MTSTTQPTIDINRASESIAEMVADWYGNAPLPNARITAEVIAQRLARFTTQPTPTTAGVTEAQIERLWQTLIDKDDRNSPEEYPEMALITFDEFAEAVRFGAALAPAGDGVPGMVLVPREPTKAMLIDGCAIPGVSLETGKRMWRAMLSASTAGDPKP